MFYLLTPQDSIFCTIEISSFSRRFNIIIVPLIIEIVGYFLMTIPFIFWDYDSTKQNAVMQVLQRRAEVTEGAVKDAEQPVTTQAVKGD